MTTGFATGIDNSLLPVHLQNGLRVLAALAQDKPAMQKKIEVTNRKNDSELETSLQAHLSMKLYSSSCNLVAS